VESNEDLLPMPRINAGLDMNASDLREGYRQAIASPLAISKIAPENGFPIVLYNSDWVRILFVRGVSDSSNTIEVELSISARSNSANMDQKEAISTLISHLNYFLRLYEYGFKLEAMDDDVLWTAVIDIPVEPDIQLFEILLPPAFY
jgi:hypothetical protein